MSVENSSLESSSYEEEILDLLTARLNSDNCGNISLTYKDKWKSQIEMKLACIEDFDVEGKSLGKVDLLEQHGKFNLTSPPAKKEEGMLFPFNNGVLPSDPEGTQMPTLATEVSTGQQERTQIELESFIFNSTRGRWFDQRVGTHDGGLFHALDGDFKINLKLKRHGKQELGNVKTEQESAYDDDEVHFVDVQLMVETDTALLYDGNHSYQVLGTEKVFYVPNYFYAFDHESKKMKMQTMEEGFPKLSELSDDSGSQYFTFRFTNSIEEIFYDLMMGAGVSSPSALMGLSESDDQPAACLIGPSDESESLVDPMDAQGGNEIEVQPDDYEEGSKYPADFSEKNKMFQEFKSKELKAGTNLTTWLQGALPSGFDQLMVLNNIKLGFENYNDEIGVDFAKHDGHSLVAIKGEKTVKKKKLKALGLLRFKTSKTYFRIEMIYIVADNEAADRQLKALGLNRTKIWNFYHRTFVVDE